MGSFSMTRVDVAGSLVVLEAVFLAQGWRTAVRSSAVRITAYLKCRILPCELDTAFFILAVHCISHDALHALTCSLLFQTAGWC